MRRKSGSTTRRRQRGFVLRALWAGLLSITLFSPYVALAADEECDIGGPLFTSPANDLCVPAVASSVNFVIDGAITTSGGAPDEWDLGTYYEHTTVIGDSEARVRISRKATGINKSDLFLLFTSIGDATQSDIDEIRIGLNPVANPAPADSGKNTLIKIHPFPVASPAKEAFTFNTGTNLWVPAGAGDPWSSHAQQFDMASATWTVEVKISLDAIPVNPITGSDFRLQLELHAGDGADALNFQWPPQYGFVGQHDHMCSNPQRWQPMSFGGNCPHPDLNIANGLYSCNAVYVLRNGVKSTEISVVLSNEFHADVTNPSAFNATNTEVYLTLLQLGVSTGPIAMNYSHTDANIVNFFNSKYGSWMTATDSLDTGSPRPPTPFTANAGTTNTGARFNWLPSGETCCGPPAGFVASHKCTAAFVNFKDDPNFANNFSYCNTSIVNCPTGLACLLGFSLGQFYPYLQPREGVPMRISIKAINEPFPGWLNRSRIRFEGDGVKRVGENLFEVRLPAKREVPIKLSLTPPRVPENYRRGLTAETGAAAAAQEPPGKREIRDFVKERNELFKKIYGDRPLIVIDGVVPTSFKTGTGAVKRVQLYAPSSYVAFAVDDKAGPRPGGTPRGGGRCGRSGANSFAYSSFFALIGLTLAWRRSRHRRKNDGTHKKG